MKKQTMGLFAFAMSAASLLVAGHGSASCDQPCDPCGTNYCCGSFEVGAEALYMRPQTCGLGYAIDDRRAYPEETSGGASVAAQAARLPQGKARGIDPDYKWGFRVMAGYVFDGGCSDVQVHYTWHHARHKKRPGTCSEATGSLWPTYGHPKYLSNALYNPITNVGLDAEPAQIAATACSRVKFDYDAVDLQFGSRSMKGCDMWVRAFVGLHYANLDFRRHVSYTGTINPGVLVVGSEEDGVDAIIAQNQVSFAKDKAKFWGIGPEFGVDARYHVACGFGIGARVTAALIAGETDGRMFQAESIVPVGTTQTLFNPPAPVEEVMNVCFPNRTLVVPMLNARLGINYTWCCNDCFAVVGEVGYEFITYINALHTAVFNDQGATLSESCDSYNLQGLYIMGRVTF